MFATCIHCHAPLGRNEALEHFPVGRRIALDAAKGRLWVVCAACRQWNLTPLEERWEAIEEGGRLFRDTRLRVSTDNIGLARLRDGTELVRIGAPQRPEFAAWRYGGRFTRRWYLNAPGAAAGTAVAAVAKVGVGNLIWTVGLTPVLAIVGLQLVARHRRFSRKALELRLGSRARVTLTQAHIEAMRIVPSDRTPEGWALRVPHAPEWRARIGYSPGDPVEVLEGVDATRALTRLLPRLNRTGGRRGTVSEAVALLERYGDANAVFRKASRYDVAQRRRSRIGRFQDEEEEESEDRGHLSDLAKAPAPVRLAAEMAAHDEQERAFLEGELDDLTDRWREAEEVAAIADELTLPTAVIAQLERLRLR